MQSPLPILVLSKYSGSQDEQILLWQWRNDVSVRKWAKPGMVSLYDFARSLEGLVTVIGYIGDDPVGYAQLESDGRMFWMIDRDKRRKGLGPLLALETARYARGMGLNAYVRVHPDNRTSLAILSRIGFTHTGNDDGRIVMTYAA